jgi:DNA end-binding protein Ku
LGVTLRYPYEIRKEADYFSGVPDEIIPKDMLDLAINIVESKAGRFKPEKFEDHYENALRELIEKKERGEKIEKPKERPRADVVNLMDALRRSAAAVHGGPRTHPPRAAARDTQSPVKTRKGGSRRAS